MEIPEAIRLAMLDQHHQSVATTYATPGDLAQAIDPRIRQTPALDIIDQAILNCIDQPDGRLIISMAPQEGKSQRAAIATPIWQLRRNPDTRIAVASYAQGLANRNGRSIRNAIQANPWLGMSIAADNGAASEWQLAGHDGGVISVGRGAGITGRPVDCLIIDDPLTDRQEADSKIIRDNCWDWWTDSLSTRLSPGAPVVLIMCMTGDTAVLLPDGTEKPLRDVRPGDEVATYEDGGLSVATVRNWANQGPDDLFRVMMKSGRVVRANARHPFLSVDANGVETWLRTDQIRPGVSILTATGESGMALSAPSTDATNLHAARGCVTPTTAKPAGPLGTGRLRSTLRHVVELALSTATVSRMRKWTSSSLSRAASALSAASPRPTRTPEPTGTASSASTTTTTPARCADSSATTAISQSDTARRQKLSGQPLTTWSITPDEVVAVESCGREDVYDVQIDRTENFIANGLVSHNTRWHEADLAGRLVSAPDGHIWRVLNIPAQAETTDDPLHRAPGEYMISARGRRDWDAIKIRVGARAWASLYQGRPSPADGGIFRREAWGRYQGQRWLTDERGANWCREGVIVQSWDLAFKGGERSDYVVGQVWQQIGSEAWILDQVRGRWTFSETCQQIAQLSQRWPQATAKYVEDKANGPAVMDALGHQIPGLIPVQPEGGKESRAAAVSPMIEAGNVHLPESAPWVGELIEEAAGFPNSAHDDQVDALTQALTRLYLTHQRAGTGFYDIG